MRDGNYEVNPIEEDTLIAFVIAVGHEWRSSPTVKQMDAEQVGWFGNLLIAAWTNAVEPATLPNDEPLLKTLAGFTSVMNSYIQFIKRKRFSKQKLEELELYREKILTSEFCRKRWKFVRDQFVPFSNNSMLVHNPEFGDIYRDDFLAALREVRSLV